MELAPVGDMGNQRISQFGAKASKLSFRCSGRLVSRVGDMEVTGYCRRRKNRCGIFRSPGKGFGHITKARVACTLFTESIINSINELLDIIFDTQSPSGRLGTVLGLVFA